MSAPSSLMQLLGTWTGPSRLWLPPETNARECTSLMIIARAAKENFLTFAYTWTFDGDLQDGLLLLGQDHKENAVQAVWIDSWHMQDKFMICQGSSNMQGVISIKGYYAAPPGPDWGWRIVIDPTVRDTFSFLMFNITPDGQEVPAVEAIYSQQKP